MKTILSIAVPLFFMNYGSVGVEFGSINHKAIPAPFEDLIINPKKYDGMAIRTFCFLVAEQGEPRYLVGSNELIKFYSPLNQVYADFRNLKGSIIQINIHQLTGLYVLVEGKFSVQFADENFVGTAFRTLDLSRILILDERWYHRRHLSDEALKDMEDFKDE